MIKNSKLLVIDNYDSFTFNLVQMFMHFNLIIKVFRSDMINITQAKEFKPDYILISPGPKNPSHSGISIPIIKYFFKEIPILGVCLGMQCIGEYFGWKTIPAPKPMHGKTSLITHYNKYIFKNIKSPFYAMRYHSLMVDIFNNELDITAKSEDGVIMGLSHKKYPLHGVQFHPESFLTENGFLLIENFLKLGNKNG